MLKWADGQVAEWLRERCAAADGEWIATSELHADFLAWNAARHGFPLSSRGFVLALRRIAALDVAYRRHSRTRRGGFQGLRLVAPL